MAETIGIAWSEGWEARIKCNGRTRATPKSSRSCLFGATLDLQTLVLTRGYDFPLDQVGGRLMCPHCRSRSFSVFWLPPSARARA